MTKVTTIIDFCLEKKLEVVEGTNLHSLKLKFTSKASCRQREGRSGRDCNGEVFRLITKDMFESLEEFMTPKILDSPLEDVVLIAKPPNVVLQNIMSPPKKADVKTAIKVLKHYGALQRENDEGLYEEEN